MTSRQWKTDLTNIARRNSLNPSQAQDSLIACSPSSKIQSHAFCNRLLLRRTYNGQPLQCNNFGKPKRPVHFSRQPSQASDNLQAKRDFAFLPHLLYHISHFSSMPDEPNINEKGCALLPGGIRTRCRNFCPRGGPCNRRNSCSIIRYTSRALYNLIIAQNRASPGLPHRRGGGHQGGCVTPAVGNVVKKSRRRQLEHLGGYFVSLRHQRSY